MRGARPEAPSVAEGGQHGERGGGSPLHGSLVGEGQGGQVEP